MKCIRIEGDLAFVELTRKQEAKIDVADVELVQRCSWQAVPNGTGGFYAKSTKFGYMHRLITGAPKGSEVDHDNHDTLDNRRTNLQVGTHQANTANGKFALTTHCPKGHEYTDENTYRNGKGKRFCRICNAERVAGVYANETQDQREERRKRVKEYYERTKGERLEKMKAYTAAHKEEKREYDRQYHAAKKAATTAEA